MKRREETQLVRDTYFENLEKLENGPLLPLLKTRQFLSIFVMNSLTFCFGTFIVGSVNSWALSTIRDVKFLSTVASFGSVFGSCRFVWSFLLDRFSYKLIYGIMICCQIVVGLALPTIINMHESPFKYIIYFFLVCLSFNAEGGHFVMNPTVYAKLFG